jgi:hypothetical protein
VGLVQPSSLIFVVVILVWAAYVTQDWVKRRDHIATARTIDRFSESMRVLDHRAALAAAAPHSSGPGMSGSPAAPAMVRRPDEDGVTMDAEPGQHPTARRERQRQPEPGRRQHAGGRGGSPRPRPVRRRGRGTLALLAVVGVLAATPLAALGYLEWVAPAACAGVLVLSLVWVRLGLAASRRARAAAQRPVPRRVDAPPRGRDREAARSMDAEWTPRRDHAPPRRHPADERAPEEEGVTRVEADHWSGDEFADPSGGQDGTTTSDSPYDIFAVEEADHSARRAVEEAASAAARRESAPTPRRPVQPELDEDDMPLTWDPVPVPRPTYTMKARAYYPDASRGTPVEPTATGEAPPGTGHTAYGRRGARRAVGG